MAAAAGAGLANAVLNVSAVKDFGRATLVQLLESVPGRKALVLDPQLSGPLSYIAERQLLKEHGVEKTAFLLPQRLDTDTKAIIYLVRPDVQLMKHLALQIRAHAKEGQRKDYTVVFAPRRTMICERVLEEEGVYGELTVAEYPLDLLPVEADLLSLELPGAYRDARLNADRSPLFYTARALLKLQAIFGLIPTIRGVGNDAKLVKDMLARMRKETSWDENLAALSEIDMLVIVDRDVDMVTPMCTQLTYEGLIDEVIGITNSQIDIDPEVLQQSQQSGGAAPQQAPAAKGGKPVKIALNSNDKVFSEIRDLNFSVIGPSLNKKAKLIEDYYKRRHEAQTVSQIRDFMKGLGSYQAEHQQLRIHTHLAEQVATVTKSPEFHRRLEAEQTLLAGGDPTLSMEYIEECINKQMPLEKVLRLVVLFSLTQDGFKPKAHEFVKREIVQTYGYEFLLALNNLERMGLFTKSAARTPPFSALRKPLNLIVQDVNEQAPNDIAYVYSGYSPVSVRMVQQAVRGSMAWKELAKQGLPVFEDYQNVPGADAPRPPGRNQVVLVCLLGGATFTELSAIRFLAQLTPGYDFVICTTKLINGDTLLYDTVLGPIEAMRKARAPAPPLSSSAGAPTPAPAAAPATRGAK